jgi:hypothetical protein
LRDLAQASAPRTLCVRLLRMIFSECRFPLFGIMRYCGLRPESATTSFHIALSLLA